MEGEIKNTAMGSAVDNAAGIIRADLEWIPDSLDLKRSTAPLVGDPAKPRPLQGSRPVGAGWKIGLHRT